MGWDLPTINRELDGLDGAAVVRWAIERSDGAVICSTNFRPQEAVILHMVTREMSDMPILWADGGYALPETYRFAHKLMESLALNMHITQPQMTRHRWEALHGEVPTVDDVEAHEAFTAAMKIEPFHRGLQELSPRIWLTAIRSSQTDFRANLEVASLGPGGVLRLTPVFHWSDEDMDRYLVTYGLPDESVYYDPTKAEARRECGLHLPEADDA